MRKVILPAAAILLALSALSGCGVRHDLTPELLTLEDRPVDVDNTISLTCNEDWRMLVEDWQRAALLDRPPRLTPEAMPH